MTPDERLERWKLFEAQYGSILMPPPDLEEMAENHAWLRFCESVRHVPRDSFRPQGMGQG